MMVGQKLTISLLSASRAVHTQTEPKPVPRTFLSLAPTNPDLVALDPASLEATHVLVVVKDRDCRGKA